MLRLIRWLLSRFRRWRGSPAMYWKQGGSYVERDVLSDDDKLHTAVQSHIDAGRTREARQILAMIDTPLARVWLARLESEE